MSIDAIDISDNNGTVNISQVAATGVRIIISKCSEGTYGPHPGFAANWQACGQQIAAGKLARRGAYHFARADASPTANAGDAARNIGPMTGLDFAALDCEAPSRTIPWALPPGEPSIQWVLATLNELERVTSRLPWLYCSLGFLTGVLRSDRRLARFPLWIADINPITSVPTPWPYALWQFSWTGRVAGVNSNVDCSRFGPAYAATLGPVTPPKPPPPPVTTPIEEDNMQQTDISMNLDPHGNGYKPLPNVLAKDVRSATVIATRDPQLVGSYDKVGVASITIGQNDGFARIVVTGGPLSGPTTVRVIHA